MKALLSGILFGMLLIGIPVALVSLPAAAIRDARKAAATASAYSSEIDARPLGDGQECRSLAQEAGFGAAFCLPSPSSCAAYLP